MKGKTDKIIVVEGCDLTGKDTLCEQLAKKYDLDFVHFTSHDPKDFEFYKQSLRKKNVVYSRNFLGELIYPSIYKRKPELDFVKAVELNEVAKLNNVKMIVLTCEPEQLKLRLAVRGEEHQGVADNLELINKKFCDLANQFHLSIVDTMMMSFENICKEYFDE